MKTVNFESWTGAIDQIGAIYPFIGSEMFLVIVCVIFWLGWHLMQINIEEEEFSKLSSDYGSSEELDKIIKSEFYEH